MHGTVTLNARDQPNGPAIIWADQRSASQAQEFEEAIGPAMLAITGSRVSPGFQAATVRWLARHEPDRWRDTASLLLPKDFIRLKLTGERITEPTDASGSLLFDIQHLRWSETMIAHAGVSELQVPSVCGSAEISGLLTREAALMLGLPPRIPVVGGAADAPAAALGAGIINPGDLMITLSSGAQVYTPLTTPLIDESGRLHTFASPFTIRDPAPWYCMGATLNAGLVLTWLHDLLGPEGADVDYERLIGLTRTSVAGANGLLFLPYLSGERVPHFDAGARGAFIGFDVAHTRGDLVRAVLEGVSLALHDAWEILKSTSGCDPERITLAGGGSRSAIWQQIIADLFGRPVRSLVGHDQSALGAAMLAATVNGERLVDLAKRWPRFGTEVPPDRTRHDRYQALVPLFRTAYQSNAALMHDLSDWRRAAAPG
jgi:xylulokinase